MKYSQLIGKPLKQKPADADTKNHELLVQAGFVRRLMAGVYTYLPLGLKTLKNIASIVREEMDGIGGQEILMPSLHPSENWMTTGGWDSIDVLFKLTSRTEKEYALGQSHEEVVTPLVKDMVQSYKDLPLAVYQLQWKFRDELRSKSGILRGREFWMKDMYSFHQTPEDFERFYEQVKAAYLRIFKRLGLTAKVTEASGGAFSQKISYEFMVLTDAGEDDILYCDECEFCVNVEIATQNEGETCPKCGAGHLAKARASEVGNVFDLGQKYTKDFHFGVTTEDGSQMHPYMGCYGIGITRTMGVIVEKSNDEKGIIWPSSVAPYQVHLVAIGETQDKAQDLYERLQAEHISVLWDDRNASAGVKFADADLVGLPVRLVISPKTGEKIEVKKRTEGQSSLLTTDEVISLLKE